VLLDSAMRFNADGWWGQADDGRAAAFPLPDRFNPASNPELLAWIVVMTVWVLAHVVQMLRPTFTRSFVWVQLGVGIGGR
jgi:hypothetical protein